MADMQLFGQPVPPGQRTQFRAKVGEQNDGTDVTVPVIVVRGAQPGPTLGLIGAIHGDEYAGWNIMRTVLPMLDPQRLRGTVVALPIANPYAFYAEARVNKFDYEFLNLNRIWPGDPHGFLSQRMAHAIFEGCLRSCDALIDYHEGGRDFLARYLIIGGAESTRAKVHDREREMAAWFGQGIPVYDTILTDDMIRMGRWGTLSEAAGGLGIPTLVPELGGGGSIWESYLQDGMEGTRNVLIGLGMLDGTMRGHDRQQVVTQTHAWIRAGRGGLLVNRVQLGDIVTEHAVLGEIIDPFGHPVETLRAPFQSVVMDVRFTTAAHPGDWAFHCGLVS